ncbi:MAG TPA: putative Ig domain-containing protein [Gammaproteobacteria bacterium]|nr:putative Ig domain-containing protein [Gammaproteobacteria bacterium]
MAAGNLSFRTIVLLVLVYVIQGCGDGGSDTSPVAASDAAADPNLEIDAHLGGSVGDGPVANAALTVRANNGQILHNAVSSQLAGYDVVLKAKGKYYPLTVEATGGTDLVTNLAPDFQLKSAALDPRTGTIANLNPFTTLALATAGQMSGGQSAANIKSALGMVVAEFNSGLTTLVTSSVMNTRIDASNMAQMVKSSETLAELLRRVNAIRVASGRASTVDDVIAVIGADMVDGKLDGRGAARADAHASAVTVVAAAQVLVESMTNDLEVNGQAAAPIMDRVIKQLTSNKATTLTASLPATAGMIAAARAGVAAANSIAPSAALATLQQSLGNLAPGMLPADVAKVLPSGASAALAPALTQLVAAAPGDVDTITSMAGSPVANSPPTIFGSPPTTAAIGVPYSFQPTASDPNGDALTFSVANLPSWAAFDPQSGRLSGTPPAGSAGTFGNILISVSDGVASASLPAFAITVSTAPNAPPTLSGTPATSVMQGTLYSFQPTASDANGDSLVLSIANRPSWATFSAATGLLQGTPGAGDVGTTTGIVISVSDGVATASIGPFNIAVQAVASGSVTLTWQPPTQNTDGSSLTDLAGYKIYWGTKLGTYPNVVAVANPGITSYVVQNLVPNTYYFVMTAVSSGGAESAYSDSVSKTIQ